MNFQTRDQRPDMDDLPHTEWKCESCNAVNSMWDGTCQFCPIDNDAVASTTDLDDDLSDLISAPLRDQAVQPPTSYNGGVPEGKLYQKPEPKAFERPCDKCRGSGQFRGYTGRTIGACFTCNGTGKIVTKTDTVKAKASRQAKQQRTAAEYLADFKLAEPAVFAWFDGSTFPFAVAMREAVAKYGSLTERQMAASLSAIEKFNAARARVEIAKTERAEQAKPVNVSAIEEAFAKALPGSKRLPKLFISGMKIYPAKAESPNAGSLYVRGGPGYLGKITSGKFFRSRECTPEMEANVLAVLADPKAAAIKSGRLTGTCAVCARELTDADSIAAGIGPICAAKFGW